MTDILIPTHTDFSFLIDCFQRRPTKRKNIDIPEYSETTIIPEGKYRAAQFRLDRAPYVIEPMKKLSPGSNTQEVRLMFPAQSSKTTIGEILVMYYIEILPSEILHVDSNADQCRIWFQNRIFPRAKRKGIQFRAQIEGSRRTGNTLYNKEFDGGNLDLASALSAAQLASKTKRIIHACEVDRWREELGPEGLTWEIMYARTQAWGNQRKILAESTPTTYENSLIFQLYEEGDQKLYWVECPICREPQTLELYAEKKYGLYYETKAGRIDEKSVFYICPSCEKKWKEHRKHAVLNTGKWKAQVRAKSPYISSYHINGIYSPFLGWEEIARKHSKIGGEYRRQKSFDNLIMGRPSKETGVRPKAEKIIEMKGVYHAGIVPEGVLFLTIGVDVQQGSKTDKKNPPRIEFEVLGHGPGYRTWSIDYIRITGKVTDPADGAWRKFQQWAIKTGLTWKRKSDKKEFTPVLIFIDSGDGNLTSTVYTFTQGWKNTFPIKGAAALKPPEKGDPITKENFSRYRYSVVAEGLILYTIATNFYKTLLYNNLKIRRIPGEVQSPGFCDFPFEYGLPGKYEKYFSMLTAEEKLKDCRFDAGGRRNESLDCRVYALCAADVYLYGLLKNLKDSMKGKMSKVDIEKITRKWIIDRLKKEIGVPIGY